MGITFSLLTLIGFGTLGIFGATTDLAITGVVTCFLIAGVLTEATNVFGLFFTPRGRPRFFNPSADNPLDEPLVISFEAIALGSLSTFGTLGGFGSFGYFATFSDGSLFRYGRLSC
jgi:hypothetical protein